MDSSACIPKGYLQGHYLTPGAQQLLQQHLAPPPLARGRPQALYEVERDAQGLQRYVLVKANDDKKLIMLTPDSQILEKRTRVEEITDPCHPCLRNGLPNVKLPEGCGRLPLRTVFVEAAEKGTVVGVYGGHIRTSEEDNALSHMEGHYCTRLFMESYSVDITLPAVDGSDPLSLVVAGDPEQHRMATFNDVRAWWQPFSRPGCNCARYLAATANCTTRTFLWVKREAGPAEPRLLCVPLLVVMTSRKVEVGEEATWAYGDGYWSDIERNVREFETGQKVEAELLASARSLLAASAQLLEMGNPQAALKLLQAPHQRWNDWLKQLRSSHKEQAAYWAELHPAEAAAPGPLERRIRAVQAALESEWERLLQAAASCRQNCNAALPPVRNTVPGVFRRILPQPAIA